jgi:hypothetical protein
VDHAKEEHYGEHWADSRNSEVLGGCQERQEQSEQENGSGYDPPRTVFSALFHHSPNIREIRNRQPAYPLIRDAFEQQDSSCPRATDFASYIPIGYLNRS